MIVIFSFIFFFFKQKTAYEMRISDWSSDVCSSDLFGIKVGDAQARRRLTRSRGNKANQKPERIAISRDRMAACLHLRAKPVGEEALEQRRERHAGHEQISRS